MCDKRMSKPTCGKSRPFPSTPRLRRDESADRTAVMRKVLSFTMRGFSAQSIEASLITDHWLGTTVYSDWEARRKSDFLPDQGDLPGTAGALTFTSTFFVPPPPRNSPPKIKNAAAAATITTITTMATTAA